MKSILVPTEQNAGMESALDSALLLAKKFDSWIEGFPLRPAVADMVAMDPDAGLTMVAVRENDADMVRQAEELFRSFMERHGIQRQAAARVNQKVRVLDALGNALVGKQLADVVAGEEGPEVFRRDIGIDSHCDLQCVAANPPRASPSR